VLVQAQDPVVDSYSLLVLVVQPATVVRSWLPQALLVQPVVMVVTLRSLLALVGAISSLVVQFYYLLVMALVHLKVMVVLVVT